MHSLSCSALVMEGSEPSLVPEWLRSNVGGNHFSSSQTDGTSSSLPKRNKASKIISNSNSPYSSFIDRSSSTSSRRSLCSNGSSKHDRNSYSRSYNYSTRNQPKKDRERFGVSDVWDFEDSEPLKGMKDTLRRSHSMMPRRPSELSHRRVVTNLRNSSHNINANGTNGTISVHRGTTGIQEVSLERDFPLLGSDERPVTPDTSRVPSPWLSTGVQDLPVGMSSLASCEGRTSVLAEVPMGGNGISSSSVPYAAATATGPVSAPSAGASNGLNMAEALVKVPPCNNAPQQSAETQRSKELPFMVSKRLIPVTPSMPKNSVHNLSDKLKPKTASRPIDMGVGPKNGLQRTSSLQLGSQSGRSISARGDGPKSSSTGKMVLLKPARENGVSPAMKGTPSQTINGSGMITNSPSISVQSVASIPFQNPNKAKLSTNARRTCAYGLNAATLIDKRLSLAQLQSRNDFFNLVRKKSLSSTSSDGSSVVGSSGGHNSDELKELASGPVTLNENGSDVKCVGNTCSLVENFSDCRESEDAGVYSNEKEKAFLRSLGWEENAGDDEGLTEEEINGFYQKYMEWIPASKLCRGLQLKIMT